MLRFLDYFVHIGTHAWINFKVPFDKLFRFLTRNTEVLIKAVIAKSVYDTKIYCFRLSLLILSYFTLLDMKYIHTCLCMNIHILIEGVNEAVIVRYMGKDS